MSNNYTSGSGNGASGNSSSFVSRREIRANNVTGAMAPVTSGRSYSSSFDFESTILSLRELFEHDRQVSSQSDMSRCGICYLHFFLTDLRYREEEGFYVCQGCERSLGKQVLPMVRRQQK